MSIGNSPTDDCPSVGRALAQARLDAGLTVGEVSITTRVRIPIVYAIEQDDFSRCGGDVYARGHIRSLARAVGLDPEPLIQRYAAEHGGRPSSTLMAPLYEAGRISPEPRRPNWTAAMVAAIVATIGFVGFTLFSGGSADEGQSIAGKPSAVDTSAKPSQPHKESADPKPEQPDSAIAAAPADKVTMKLAADGGKSWIQATDGNGRLLYQGVLGPGMSKTLTDAERINLVVGNAGAVNMFVNGKDLGSAGKIGQVVRLNFTPGDPEVG